MVFRLTRWCQGIRWWYVSFPQEAYSRKADLAGVLKYEIELTSHL